jgi:NAD(P)-dependent dehydrogenase (short-subunit alcohol dehydrogenase family)
MTFDFKGKVALVTGGTTGIGRAIVDGLATGGARVLVNSENAEQCDQVVAELRAKGLDADALPADLSQKDGVEGLAAKAWSAQERLDMIFCNAGITGSVKLGEEGFDEDSSLVFDINIHHPRRLCDILLPKMAAAGTGSAVFTSSLSGLRGNKNIGVYSLTKAALAQLARDYAVRYGPSNVRVNAVSPGLIATGWETAILSNPEAAERRLGMTPLKRVGKPEEIANVALFLASDLPTFVTGHNLVADGGTLITDGN